MFDQFHDTILEMITTETFYWSLHSDHPGKFGFNETTVVSRAEIEPYDWNDPEDDPPTGGRRVGNINTISWGEATGSINHTYIGAWTEPSGGNFIRGWQLTNPLMSESGKEIFAPPNALQVVAG